MPDLDAVEEASDDDAFDGLPQFTRRGISAGDASANSLDESDSESEDDFIPETSLLSEHGAVPLEPFHLRNEKEEGSLDEEGNFSQTREQLAESRDAWLDTIDESRPDSSLDKSRAAAEKREEFWNSVEAGSIGPLESTENLLYLLIRRLTPGETPRSAMDRYLGRVTSSKGFKSTIKAKRGNGSGDNGSTGVKDMPSFEAVTELTDSLVAKGIHDVLVEPRERLQGRLGKLQFEYRWKTVDNSEIYGPFSFEALLNWDRQGCFTANPIQVRYSGTNSHWRDFKAPE